jgi:hypothetical protein
LALGSIATVGSVRFIAEDKNTCATLAALIPAGATLTFSAGTWSSTLASSLTCAARATGGPGTSRAAAATDFTNLHLERNRDACSSQVSVADGLGPDGIGCVIQRRGRHRNSLFASLAVIGDDEVVGDDLPVASDVGIFF